MEGKGVLFAASVGLLLAAMAGCAQTGAETAMSDGPVVARRLNNFVVEYVNTNLKAPRKDRQDRPLRTFEIDHFRRGWIFIRGQARGGRAYVTVDSGKRGDAVLVLDGQPREAMRYISKGKHRIRVFADGGARIDDFLIRSIPELQISELNFAVARPTWGGRKLFRDWDFYRKHTNPNMNVIISDVDKNREWEPYAAEWRSQGKKWLFKTSQGPNLALLKEKGREWFEDHYYKAWTGQLEAIPYLDGIALDEWASAEVPEAYLAYADIFDRIAQNPACAGKQMHVYGLCGGKPWFKPGFEAIQRNNFTYLHEGYFFLRGSSDETEQKKFIASWAGDLIPDRYRQYPGLIENNLVYVVGAYDYHVSLDVSPDLDFKVFLDLQFHHYANYPTLKGLYGVSLYPPAYAATTDLLLHASKLVRHYCIEGNRDRMTDAPLRLGHLENPGFEQGLANWEVKRAAADSVGAVLVKETKYKKRHSDQVPPSGEKMLRTTRSGEVPNQVSQKIVGLTPGRRYSLTLYVADYSDFGKLQLVPVSIELHGVEEVADKAVDRPMYTGDYSNIDRGCWNYHFRVFRANGTSAELTLSDWGAADAPVGEIGREIIWDHVKVQPYFDGNPVAQ